MSRSEALTKALPLLLLLEERGFEAVFVGGCVRDTLLGKPLKDVDIATAASPEQVVAIFPHTVPTGLQHGTVTVVHEGERYEVTTFRTESEYEQFRRPSHVQFVTSLHEDLQRRDFTINSMAMRADGTLVDPFGGQRDLEHRILRCVGDADARLQEDALRIVRAVRFAAAYELRIAHGTWRAIRRHKELLAHIAMERIGLEFDKMIGGIRPNRAAALLAASGLLSCTKEALPLEIVAPATAYAADHRQRRLEPPLSFNSTEAIDQASKQAMEQLASTIRVWPEIPDSEDRWAALCAALPLHAGQAQKLFGTLRYSTARTMRLTAILHIHAAMVARVKHVLNENEIADQGEVRSLSAEMNKQWILTVLNEGQAAAISWLAIIRSSPSLIAPNVSVSAKRRSAFEQILKQLEHALHAIPAAAIRDLAVKGKDLLNLTDKPSGPWLGLLLQQLLNSAALGEVPNEKGPLLAEAASILNDHEVKPS